ncbi:MAG: two-component system response regulator [Dechloromonas agitata]|uniref:Two-component system response regulator n=1 Tax=Dechloromonas agitata TaxID=73030 RepID=A0A930BX32_9RHOO|nr:two-component system response regulator [Dechloromonas agitata]
MANTILIVDDNRDNLTVIGGLLKSEYHVRVANSGERALQVAVTAPIPDLILLDIMMPGMDGYETLHHLRAMPETRNIPVIFVTAMSADEDEEAGLRLGAVDYITKPIRPAILNARVRTHLALKRAHDQLADQNTRLESQVRQRTRELELIKEVTMQALATLAEKRDNETGNHLIRTRSYIEVLMHGLSTLPEFAGQLDPLTQELIAKAAPLHDIGKVGIPDAILLKPGRLTPEEFLVMKTHAQIGADALTEAIERVLRGQEDNEHEQDNRYALSFLEIAREIAGGHHEKWDGSGYPRGLSGNAIPLSARLMALADVFDALVCKRHYKEAFPIEKSIEIIRQGRGQHFDPRIVDVFLANIDACIAIAERHADHPPEATA